MQMKHGGIRVMFVTLALLPPSFLKADAIFSNLSTGTVSTFSEVFFSGETAQSLAAEFTPTADSIMSEAEVNVQGPVSPGLSNLVNLSLYSNSSGVPGSPLETLGTNLAAPLPMFGIVSSSSFAPIPLTAGTEYWLVMTPSNFATAVMWAGGGPENVPNANSPTSDGGAPWSLTPPVGLQFEIGGVVVPEPGTASFLAVGLGLVTLVSRLRRSSR